MKPHVVFLDDDRYEMLGLVEALEGAGFDVAYFTDTEEGEAYLSGERTPDLIITDLLMSTDPATPPNMRRQEGVEFCRLVRDKYKLECPLIVLTVVSSPIVHAEVEKYANDILVKPVLPAELVRRVRGALKR